MSIAAAKTQDRMAAGPAAWVALSALNSQPEPMIDPSETNISPQKPTVRCNPGLVPGVLVSVAIAVTPRPKTQLAVALDGIQRELRAVHDRITPVMRPPRCPRDQLQWSPFH